MAASWPISSVGPIKLDSSADSVIARFAFVIFFGIFDLQFFSFLLPPFCITSGAANLDQLDMILITALTRLLPFVIILAIIALQWCNHYGYCRVPKCWQHLSQRFKVVRWLTGRMSGQSAAHGLSAFFILVYTRFLGYWGVLTQQNVIVPSNTSNASAIAVLDFQGNLNLGETKHIVVAVVILLLSVFMILLPTCLLLAYPTIPQVQAKLKNSKYRALRCFSRLKCFNICSRLIIQLFADLFQSGYKDNCRFFAGLLLLVRIVLVVTWNISSSREEGYVIMTALSLAVLALHSLLSPHRRGWINVVDSLMYTHLAAMNLLPVYVYLKPDNSQFSDSFTTLYQIALFAPGAYLVLYLVCVLHKRWRRSHRRQLSTLMPSQAVGDDAYLVIVDEVEVDPPAEEDPAKAEEQDVEKSYGSVAVTDSRHQELWLNDT